VEAAGTSLLYSKEFYELAKTRLRPGGVLQAWIPEETGVAAGAAVRSICDCFPHVRCLGSIESWGMHLLASMQPMETCSAAELLARLPPAAKRDLLEWNTETEIMAYLGNALAHETPVNALLAPEFQARITDDLPYNEYFLLRQLGVLRYSGAKY
jgi:hypothetical protein